MIENERPVALEALLGEVQALSKDGYRFVTCTCLDAGESFEVFYHFDKDTQLTNLRVTFAKDAEVPSISGTYLAAILIENEMLELFGVKMTGMAIDYEGHLLIPEDEADTHPMLKAVGVTSIAVSPSVSPNGGQK